MIIIAFLLLLGFIFHHPKIKGKIGEIYVALADQSGSLCRKLTLHGNREENRLEACKAVLRLLLENCNS